MSVILKAENISKQYRLGLVGTGTISHDLNRWWAGVRGKEDPYLKIGTVNDRSTKADSDYVWALRDINFEVKKGEVLGIIGKNGAGKSTLLKILSRVTGPTTGEIKTKGRIASLLEVGTGFHPELTGRENIYLNGAILGMSKAEIKAKEQEIIEFSGCERYVDTPVKRYSSGMRVRLAFAVAAHLEPDILVIDEVLAVGDAEFQKKAIGKMQDISRGDGRTVLIVSHNMATIQNLCTRAVLLSNGAVHCSGNVDDVITEYLNLNSTQKSNDFEDVERKGNGIIKVISYSVRDCVTQSANEVLSGNDIEINLVYASQLETTLSKCVFSVGIRDSMGNLIFNCPSNVLNKDLQISKEGIMTCKIPKLPLKEGRYSFNIYIQFQNEVSDWIIDGGTLDVVGADFYNSGILPDHKNGILVDFDWLDK